MHTYRESVYLGDARLKPPQVKAILATMTPNWYGPTYDLIRKNCCSFSNAFAQKLGVDMPITEHVYHVLHRGRPLHEAAELLVSRGFKDELAGIR